MKEKKQLGKKGTQRKQTMQYDENVEKKIPSEKRCTMNQEQDTKTGAFIKTKRALGKYDSIPE